MKKTILEIDETVKNEFRRAIKDHGTSFHSYHEGYAVLLEEFQEARDELRAVHACVGAVWKDVKSDGLDASRIDDVKRHAVRAAAELVQVAAMAEKMKYTKELFDSANGGEF